MRIRVKYFIVRKILNLVKNKEENWEIEIVEKGNKSLF